MVESFQDDMKAKIFGRRYENLDYEMDETQTVINLTHTLTSSNQFDGHDPQGVLRVLNGRQVPVPTYRTVIMSNNSESAAQGTDERLSGSINYHSHSKNLSENATDYSRSTSPTYSTDSYRSQNLSSPPAQTAHAGSSESFSPNSHSQKRKKFAQPVPQEYKDDAYWERRKRNNESAKRSRELRRAKERHTSVRVLHLEQENVQLRTEVSVLREEVQKLREMLCSKGNLS